jgi:lambda family phage portal protein
MKIPFFSRAEKRAAAPAALSDMAPAPKKRSWLGRSLGGLFKAGEASANDKWASTPIAPDAYITRFHTRLVARSREQWSNNDYVRKFILLVRQNIVGPLGVTMQAKATKPRGGLDKPTNAALEGAWEDWGKKGNCEVTGQLTWRAVQALALETTARDGEFFVRMVYGTDAGPHGFALQLIDSQRIPTWYENYNRTDSGGFIRHGIEFNRFGRPIAYHFASTDEWDAYYYTFAGRGFVRIPAEEIIHGFVHEMVGQRRGLPWASTSLFRLHHLQGFEDASVQNARASATKMGFIQYKEGFGPEVEDDTNVADSIDAEPLSMHELPMGAEFVKFDPTYPSGEFAVFNKAQLRGAASGMGVPYNDLANDLEGVNFSSIRQATLDAREHYKELQQWLIETLHQPVYSAWLKWKLLRGDIKVKGEPLPPAKLDVFMQVSWQPRRWQWIDPRADVQAAIESIRAGLTSISQVIREQGRDPEAVFAEFAEDLKAMKAAGIPDDIITAFLLGELPPPPSEPANDNASTDKATA